MKVLIVGGGGREHALAWRLRRDDPGVEIVAAPGNPGIATLGRCVNAAVTDVSALAALARHERPGYVIVGPEAPLAAGLVDRLRAEKIPAFGPTQAATEIESSKAFAKEILAEAWVPTARATRHTEAATAKRAARDLGAPVVIKASGLAAGKGVIVAETLAEADAAIDALLERGEILVEEFLQGEEVSVFGVTNGTTIVPLMPSQDHKRLLDGDRGPNTGGMGAYAPFERCDKYSQLANDVAINVIRPVLEVMRDRGRPFTGLLYAGLMMTDDGPKVIEFNARFGDPETQTIMPLTGEGLGALLHAVAVGDDLPELGRSPSGHAVTTVIAAAGYPDTPRVGDHIDLPDPEDGVSVFHAGTARDSGGRLISAGGRVLSVTGVGTSLNDAHARSLAFVERVGLDGKQFRSDIGFRHTRVT
ncbi:MAG TPA: phosphoribosylamine--glycine ligase [Gemmatimonadaceae bacterium]|jgi:phosphoribosylamine--glycine ligase|nr:phosphoribosylamine--glycine ligase [Gemmatimonadaceae bacterium]